MSFKRCFFIVFVSLLSWSTSHAQNKVVVIPLTGDTVAAELPTPRHGQIDANGTLFFDSGIMSASRTAAGSYQVVFEETVNRCIPAVTAFDLNIVVAAVSVSSNTWQVDVRNTTTQTAEDGGFFIILSCPISAAKAKSLGVQPQRYLESE